MDSDGRKFKFKIPLTPRAWPAALPIRARGESQSDLRAPLSGLLEEAPPVQDIITMMLSFVYIFNVLVLN